ncbi:hypothetical protein BDN67DRAFT_985317 [Paxillus ammoniavirescens]|nr:hypothetical protein BDN67DRAFT_985317 [Paxillus ammoniavirescens]
MLPCKPQTIPTPDLNVQAPTQMRLGRLVIQTDRAQTKPKVGKPPPKLVVLCETSTTQTTRPKLCVVQKKAATEPELNILSDDNDMDENNAQSVKNIETNSSNEAEAALSGPVPGPAGLDDDTDSLHWRSPDADNHLAVLNLLRGGVPGRKQLSRATLANPAPLQASISKVSTSKAVAKSVAKSVSGRKARKVPLKTTALLSDLEMDEEEDVSGDDDNNEDSDDDEGHEGGKARRKGPLTAEVLAECDALGEKIEAMKYNFWNIHQAWFYGMQAEEGKDPAVLKQCQHKHYQQIKATLKEDAPWTKIIEYAKAKETYSGPKTPAGWLMQVCDMFTQMAQAVSRVELIHVFGFAIYTGIEEGGHQAAGMWAGSKVIRSSIKKYGVDLKKMIDWWTTTLKYESANIQASAVMPRVPGLSTNIPIIKLFRSGEEADRDCNWRALKYMFLDLLVQRGYSGTSVLWRKLLKLADKLHFTIINWPDEVPVPDQHFNFHHLPLSTLRSLLGSFLWQHLGDRYEAELKEIAENSKRSKGKGKGKAKCHNDEDEEDDEEVVQPDPDNDIRFVAWSEATMEKIERSKNRWKQTPLLVSRNLKDLFYDQKPTRARMKTNMTDAALTHPHLVNAHPCLWNAHQPLDLPQHLLNIHQRGQLLQRVHVAVKKCKTIATDVSRKMIAHDWGPIVRTHARCHLCITASISARHDMGGTMQIKPNLARDFVMENQGWLHLLPSTSVDGAERGLLRVIVINPIAGESIEMPHITG